MRKNKTNIETMLQEILVDVKDIKTTQKLQDERITALEKAVKKPSNANSSSKTSTKSKKKNAPVDDKPQTKSEAIAQWKKDNGISDADAKKFGENCNKIRAEFSALYKADKASGNTRAIPKSSYNKVVEEVAKGMKRYSKATVKAAWEKYAK